MKKVAASFKALKININNFSVSISKHTARLLLIKIQCRSQYMSVVCTIALRGITASNRQISVEDLFIKEAVTQFFSNLCPLGPGQGIEHWP